MHPHLVPSPGRSLLICLTDEVFRDAVAGVAAALGYDITAHGRRGQDLVDLLGTRRPEVAIIDVALLGVEGMATVRGIREAAPETVVLLSSPLTTVLLSVVEMGVAQVVSEGDVASVRAALTAVADRSSPTGSRNTKAPSS